MSKAGMSLGLGGSLTARRNLPGGQRALAMLMGDLLWLVTVSHLPQVWVMFRRACG